MQFVRRDRTRLRDIEAQPVGRVQAALLLHMRPQLPPQRLMQQMRRRVVRSDRAAPTMVHGGNHSHTWPNDAGVNAAEMDEQVAQLDRKSVV